MNNTITTCMNLKVCIKHLFIFNATIATGQCSFLCTKGTRTWLLDLLPHISKIFSGWVPVLVLIRPSSCSVRIKPSQTLINPWFQLPLKKRKRKSSNGYIYIYIYIFQIQIGNFFQWFFLIKILSCQISQKKAIFSLKNCQILS